MGPPPSRGRDSARRSQETEVAGLSVRVAPARVPIEVAIATLAALAVGATTVGAVVAGAPGLTSILPWRVPVAANTGLCFALLGLGLWAAARGGRSSHRLALLASALVACVAGATAFQYVTGRDFGVDRLLFPAPPGASVMSPQTAVAFLLLSGALVLTVVGRAVRLVRALAALVVVVALVNLVDAVYGVERPVILGQYIQMALPTAVAFIALATGIVALRPEGTLLDLLRRPAPTGALTRRLLAAAVAIPLCLGALRIAGERAGWYDGTYGVALLTVSTILLFVAVTLFAAGAVERTEQERRRATEALREALREATDLYDNAPCGYHSLDAEGRFVRVNATECRWLGYRPDELVGRVRFVDLLTPASRATFEENFPRFRERGEVHDLEFELVRKDGSVLPVLLSATAVRDAEGRFLMSRSTVIDLTARRQAEAEREKARVAAESANRAKSEFLSRMSHELRTPLNSILGFAQLLEMDELPAEQRQYVRYIRQAGRHLLELINEVLDVSRIESGQMTISPEPVEVAELLSEILALAGPLADDRRIRIDAAPANCRSFVMADRQRLKQVLLNLVSNAIKYNRDGGSVRIACRPEPGDRLRIAVVDTGYGIPSSKLDRLFVPFDRLGAEQTGIEGTGMGLALSRGLVTAMGGQLGVESVVDLGTTVWVELPLAAPPEAAAAPDGAPATPAARPVESPQRTVLHIEDNLPNQQLVERILGHRPGIRLLSAIQGGLGLELARRHRPDLVLLDLHLPDMPGRDVLERLKSYPETRDIPVIVLSADATKRQRSQLLADGAADYIAKPIDVAAFLERIDAALAERAPR
ncbi:MAG TPA: ATP-binding protein [Candidatus Limnocylindrales bacterium]|nr:ATP-binding protein [Candidatus Limnocylindrales bacterium]